MKDVTIEGKLLKIENLSKIEQLAYTFDFSTKSGSELATKFGSTEIVVSSAEETLYTYVFKCMAINDMEPESYKFALYKRPEENGNYQLVLLARSVYAIAADNHRYLEFKDIEPTVIAYYMFEIIYDQLMAAYNGINYVK